MSPSSGHHPSQHFQPPVLIQSPLQDPLQPCIGVPTPLIQCPPSAGPFLLSFPSAPLPSGSPKFLPPASRFPQPLPPCKPLTLIHHVPAWVLPCWAKLFDPSAIQKLLHWGLPASCHRFLWRQPGEFPVTAFLLGAGTGGLLAIGECGAEIRGGTHLLTFGLILYPQVSFSSW